jgi:branched-chain amino acid transport system substrate-binding protein
MKQIVALSVLALSLPTAAMAAPRKPGPRDARLGAVLSQSGAAAVYGVSSRRGIELAVDRLNAAAGASDPLLSVTFLDDGTDPATAVRAMKKLSRSDKSLAVLGPTLSSVAFAADPLAQKDGLPVLGISNTAPGVTAIGDYVFRDSLTEAVVVPNTVHVVLSHVPFTTAALIYQTGDAYTVGAAQAFRDAAAAEGVAIVSEQSFAPGTTDFSNEVGAMHDAAPGAVFIATFIADAAAIVQKARDVGFGAETAIVGGNGLNSSAFLTAAGAAAEGVWVGAAWNAAKPDAASLAFVADFTARYGFAPDQFAAQAYAGVQILSRAIRDAGSTSDRAAVRDALAAIADLPTVLGSFSFSPERDAIVTPVVQVVSGGTFVLVP